jgi:hypothetical protein
VVDLLRTATDAEVSVTDLTGTATVTLRAPAPDAAAADRLASDLRLRAHARLREAGLLP